MSQSYSYPSSSTVTVDAIGPNGQPIPTESILVAGKDGAGDLIPVSVDSSGNVNVNLAGTVPVTGTVTANQGTAAALASAWPMKLTDGTLTNTFTANGLKVDGSAVIQPVSQSGTWNINNISGTISLPTGAATEATLLTISGQLPATLGQKAMAASFAVAIASDQSAIPVTSASLPLPSGASTSALQITGNTSLASIDTKTLTAGQKAMAASYPVVLASDQSAIPASQSGTWNINNISGTVSLPTGAATETTLAAMSAKLPATLGQKTSAASMAVVLASDQSPVSITGSISVGASAGVANAPVQNLYTSSPITTAAYTQLIASTTTAATYVDIFDSSGQAMILAVGAAASEVILYYVPPGGDQIHVNIAQGSRVSYKALSANATSGYLLLNLLQ